MDAYTVSQAVAPVLLVHSKPPASIYPTAQKRHSRKICTQESYIASAKHLWMSKPSISSAQNRSSNSLVQPFTRPGRLFTSTKNRGERKCANHSAT